MNAYLQAMKDYQASTQKIQAEYETQVAAYQVKADQYQKDILAYQQEFGEWEVARKSAIGTAEQLIERFMENFDWSIVDKSNKSEYMKSIVKCWLAQITISCVLLSWILLRFKLKDRRK